ncbi:hypothetical protein SDRG_14592 [Saprolegnia diclina VS20]|uniref:Uncharacterized protein n=1 Tax=Saprolegnia diclina (strain VS20) TaxID=1156394 RepID=T0R638_SAPDV|nr:hypothetical protein SDRG_14592 [Saprolegnia diclina VS20]EQC27533.1 hypothetical protein SDRG_14592 [Saprolegnia diclina VS20]|eukprot:XP_008618953.1 hypothetical protein SDRG_14592 [Saprolegnia diclina VS20]
MPIELRRSKRSQAANPLQPSTPGKPSKPSAPTTDDATKLAFDALVEELMAWFKNRNERVPLCGFAALAMRERHGSKSKWSKKEQAAFAALQALGKDQDDTTWSLLRTFSNDGDEKLFTTWRIAFAPPETAATLLKKQQETTANAEKKRHPDDQAALYARGSKKAKLALAATSPPAIGEAKAILSQDAWIQRQDDLLQHQDAWRCIQASWRCIKSS